jgi:hypothetical protein
MVTAVPSRVAPQRQWTDRILVVLTAVWLVSSLLVLGSLQRYANTPGQAARPVNGPPQEEPVEGEGHWRLLVFVHPHCPCSDATLDEVSRLAQRLPLLRLRIILVRPPGCPQGWEEGRLFQCASAIPGAQVEVDPDGKEARRWGARTSGQVLLLEASGRRRFQGGLTVARGHEGPSAGSAAVIALVETGRAEVEDTPVFGCPLLQDEDS